jgi:serine/threonine protein kinase
MGFMAKCSAESCVSELTRHQKVMAILSLALALDIVHAKSVIHGHVKPSNLRFSGNFHAHLSGFGAARAPEGSTMTTVPPAPCR